MIYTLTLNPSLDVDLVVPELIPDDSNRVRSHKEYAGGKGLNVSRVVKELGGSTMALVVTGGHTGVQVARLLRSYDIPFESLEVEGETRTNYFVGDDKSGALTRINERGHTLPDRILRTLFDKLDLLDLRAVSYLVLGGSLPGETSRDLYVKIIDRLNMKGDPCRIVLDADGTTMAQAIEARPAMIKPNTHEAGRVLGRSIDTKQDAIEAAKDLRTRGIETVLLSRGADGVVAATPEGVWHGTPPKVPTVSAVGSGDSFLGGFLTGLSLGMDTEKALIRGCAAGAATVLTPGTELCHAQDVNRLLRSVVVEHIE